MGVDLISNTMGRIYIKAGFKTGSWVEYLDLRDTKSEKDGEANIKKACHNLYNSSNVISVIKSRRQRWEGKVSCLGNYLHNNNLTKKKYK
jgi:hypothetical protein